MFCAIVFTPAESHTDYSIMKGVSKLISSPVETVTFLIKYEMHLSMQFYHKESVYAAEINAWGTWTIVLKVLRPQVYLYLLHLGEYIVLAVQSSPIP